MNNIVLRVIIYGAIAFLMPIVADMDKDTFDGRSLIHGLLAALVALRAYVDQSMSRPPLPEAPK